MSAPNVRPTGFRGVTATRASGNHVMGRGKDINKDGDKDIKKDYKEVEGVKASDKAISEMEVEIESGGDIKGKGQKGKKENCCGCGGCDEA
ncbi:hypothetical protein WAI453_001808 [Rhynchosporium graminicola]